MADGISNTTDNGVECLDSNGVAMPCGCSGNLCTCDGCPNGVPCAIKAQISGLLANTTDQFHFNGVNFSPAVASLNQTVFISNGCTGTGHIFLHSLPGTSNLLSNFSTPSDLFGGAILEIHFDVSTSGPQANAGASLYLIRKGGNTGTSTAPSAGLFFGDTNPFQCVFPLSIAGFSREQIGFPAFAYQGTIAVSSSPSPPDTVDISDWPDFINYKVTSANGVGNFQGLKTATDGVLLNYQAYIAYRDVTFYDPSVSHPVGLNLGPAGFLGGRGPSWYAKIFTPLPTYTSYGLVTLPLLDGGGKVASPLGSYTLSMLDTMPATDLVSVDTAASMVVSVAKPDDGRSCSVKYVMGLTIPSDSLVHNVTLVRQKKDAHWSGSDGVVAVEITSQFYNRASGSINSRWITEVRVGNSVWHFAMSLNGPGVTTPCPDPHPVPHPEEAWLWIDGPSAHPQIKSWSQTDSTCGPADLIDCIRAGGYGYVVASRDTPTPPRDPDPDDPDDTGYAGDDGGASYNAAGVDLITSDNGQSYRSPAMPTSRMVVAKTIGGWQATYTTADGVITWTKYDVFYSCCIEGTEDWSMTSNTINDFSYDLLVYAN